MKTMATNKTIGIGKKITIGYLYSVLIIKILLKPKKAFTNSDYYFDYSKRMPILDVPVL